MAHWFRIAALSIALWENKLLNPQDIRCKGKFHQSFLQTSSVFESLLSSSPPITRQFLPFDWLRVKQPEFLWLSFFDWIRSRLWKQVWRTHSQHPITSQCLPPGWTWLADSSLCTRLRLSQRNWLVCWREMKMWLVGAQAWNTNEAVWFKVDYVNYNSVVFQVISNKKPDCRMTLRVTVRLRIKHRPVIITPVHTKDRPGVVTGKGSAADSLEARRLRNLTVNIDKFEYLKRKLWVFYV